MMDFQIDTTNKNITLKVLLDGEKETLDIYIKGYEIVKHADKNFIKIKELTTSKKWMNTIAKEFVIDKEIEIPERYVNLLSIVL